MEKVIAKKKVSPRDVFLHFLTIVTLYTSAASFVTLLFQYINILVPDELFSGFTDYFNRGPLRFSVASLIVVFPVFIGASWFLHKTYRADASRRDSRLRKWLIYFTLFAAALIMIGDLVSLVYNLLGGEVTLRFVLKALSLLAVVGTVFWYYLSDVRRSEPGRVKTFAITVSAVVGVAVIGSFFLIGSPAEERLRRFDDQRVFDLQNIQSEIVLFWQNTGKLPAQLVELNDDLRGYRVPSDPESKEKGGAYEYRIIRDLNFELCTIFNRPSRGISRAVPAEPYALPISLDDTWDHGEGKTCFERTIDPERYPLFDKIKPIPR